MAEKKKIKFFNLNEPKNDFGFWMTKSPQERIYALEHLRNQFLTDTNGNRPRLQRVLTIVKF